MGKTIECSPIRIKDLSDVLQGDELVAAMAMALEELAIAQALVMIHGPKRAADKYVAMGGHVRFNSFDDEPVLLWHPSFVNLPSPFG